MSFHTIIAMNDSDRVRFVQSYTTMHSVDSETMDDVSRKKKFIPTSSSHHPNWKKSLCLAPVDASVR